MLVVVADAVMRSNEAAIINTLFGEGLQLFHLRKPQADAKDIEKLLQAIAPAHRPGIALHQHHELAEQFGLNRLHYTETQRKHTDKEQWLQKKEQGFRLSTSIHEVEEVLHPAFDYAFFGPVFNSISKQGYEAMVPNGFRLPAAKQRLVAIGGIDEKNCNDALQMGFCGVAVLGAIWQSDDPIGEFRKIQRACN